MVSGVRQSWFAAQVSASPALVLPPAGHLAPSSLPRALERIVCPLFPLVGSSTCPLLGLGAALACPLLELVGACLAFLQIGQLSVTFQTKGRIKVGTGGQERKLEESPGGGRKGLHSLGQS